MKFRYFAVIVLLFVSLLICSGCANLGYYFKAINGHLDLLSEQQPITVVLQQKDLDPSFKKQLNIALQAREFASQQLHLPDNDSYRYYADIKRSFAVWNVIASQRFSVEAKQWCFFIVGCVQYRGYFTQAEADEYAAELQTQGFDVYVAGARAYSTLGWLDDPLLNTMLKHSEAQLVGIIFHELAHQQLYIDSDSAFNEAFATTVEIEGVKRWFENKFPAGQQTPIEPASISSKYQQYLLARQRDSQFKSLLKRTRKKLHDLYNSESNNKARQKQKIFNRLQSDYQKLKTSWQGYTGYDNWMSQDLNNAHLALVATYHNNVPLFQLLLSRSQDDLIKFYAACEAIGNMPQAQRQQSLQVYKNNP